MRACGALGSWRVLRAAFAGRCGLPRQVRRRASPDPAMPQAWDRRLAGRDAALPACLGIAGNTAMRCRLAARQYGTNPRRFCSLPNLARKFV
jgi:hypothetical protein